MTTKTTAKIPLLSMTDAEVADAIGLPVESWAQQCHGISLAIIKAGLVPGARVARGSCRGVRSQHSWIVNGWDCYDPEADIIDPTLWSYVEGVPTIWHGKPNVHGHTPHGAGSIFRWGRPVAGDGPIIELEGLSKHAQLFLDHVGPLDFRGWQVLLSAAPVEGWPAAEIIDAASRDKRISACIPIDILGMLTEQNPSGLYW
jgi:hypothetical protein